MINYNSNYINELMQLNHLIKRMDEIYEEVEKAKDALSQCINYGGTIYVMGNGGSAADASHFSGEILGRFKKERKGLPAVSLTTDLAAITAIANDYSYDEIFSRQLEGLFDPLKDVILTMSTSGNSENIFNAIDYVSGFEGKSINLLGKNGGMIKSFSSKNAINIVIPSDDTPRIQEMHKFLLHYFAGEIESNYVLLKSQGDWKPYSKKDYEDAMSMGYDLNNGSDYEAYFDRFGDENNNE